MTRKGCIAFSHFWALDVVTNLKLSNRCKAPSVVPSRGLCVVSQPANLPSKRIEFKPFWHGHWSHTSGKPDPPTNNISDQIRHLNHSRQIAVNEEWLGYDEPRSHFTL